LSALLEIDGLTSKVQLLPFQEDKLKAFNKIKLSKYADFVMHLYPESNSQGYYLNMHYSWIIMAQINYL
jgi:hypothetical protein